MEISGKESPVIWARTDNLSFFLFLNAVKRTLEAGGQSGHMSSLPSGDFENSFQKIYIFLLLQTSLYGCTVSIGILFSFTDHMLFIENYFI